MLVILKGKQWEFSCEWELKFSDGTFVSIYYYKEHGVTPPDMYDWHIGGKSLKSVRLVNQAFKTMNV